MLHKIITNYFTKQKPKQFTSVAFVPKRNPLDEKPWVTFGSDKETYEQWVSEICGICCLKMVGDTFNLTKQTTLYDLTMRVYKAGGFSIYKNGSIEGVFHKPLLKTAKDLGLHGKIERNLSTDKLLKYITQHKMIILSIDLHKVRSSLHGGHLVLVYAFNKKITRSYFMIALEYLAMMVMTS